MLPENEVFVQHLSGLVQFPTVSNVDENAMDFEPFYQLHRYLEETYPLVHKTFEKSHCRQSRTAVSLGLPRQQQAADPACCASGCCTGRRPRKMEVSAFFRSCGG